VKVNTVTNGQLAVESIYNNHFDLVLMDIEMPVMDGVQCCTQIRAGYAGDNNKDIPIIMLSAHSTTLKQEQCIEAGANGYVAKPIDFNALFEQINQLIIKPKKKTASSSKTSHQKQFQVLFEQEAILIRDALDQAFIKQDTQVMLKLAHKHKSSMSMLGYTQVVELLSELELQCKQDDAVSETLYKQILSQLSG